MYKSYQVYEQKKNFTIIPNKVLFSPFISPTALKLYILLVNGANSDSSGHLTIEIEKLENAFGLSIRQIRKFLIELEELSLVKRDLFVEKGRIKGANIYLFNEINISKEKEKELIQKRQKRREQLSKRLSKKD